MERRSRKKDISYVFWSTLSRQFPYSWAAFPCHDPPSSFLLEVARDVTWHEGAVVMGQFAPLDDPIGAGEAGSQTGLVGLH